MKIDAMLNDFPQVKANHTTKIMVHDAAANMQNAARVHSGSVYENLVCIDHLLNTSLKHAESKTPEIKELFTKCKALSQRLHQSTSDAKRLQRVCQTLKVDSLKIIQPCVTRWNSNYMMLYSIHAMKKALQHVKFDKDTKEELAVLIPDATEFDTIEYMKDILEVFKKMSEKWSSEKKPTLQIILEDMVNLEDFVARRIARYRDYEEGQIANFLKTLWTEFDSRIPNMGADSRIYRLAHYFNPYYKGHFLKEKVISDSTGPDETDAFVWTEKYLIAKHQSTTDFARERNESAEKINATNATSYSTDDELNAADKLFTAEMRKRTSSTMVDVELKPPLRLEMDKYQSQKYINPKREDKKKVDEDPLSWWKTNRHDFPLLADLARGYLCVPASSAPSERLFSHAGKIVTDTRHKLDPENLSMILFIKENLSFVTNSWKDWDTKTAEEEDEDDEDVPPPSEKKHTESQASKLARQMTLEEAVKAPRKKKYDVAARRRYHKLHPDSSSSSPALKSPPKKKTPLKRRTEPMSDSGEESESLLSQPKKVNRTLTFGEGTSAAALEKEDQQTQKRVLHENKKKSFGEGGSKRKSPDTSTSFTQSKAGAKKSKKSKSKRSLTQGEISQMLLANSATPEMDFDDIQVHEHVSDVDDCETSIE